MVSISPVLCASLRWSVPILGIDSDNGSEFINRHLFDYCRTNKITFTRSRSGNCKDVAHVDRKNWSHVRTLVGYLSRQIDNLAEKLGAMALTPHQAPASIKPRVNRAFVNPPKRRMPGEATKPPSRRF